VWNSMKHYIPVLQQKECLQATKSTIVEHINTQLGSPIRW
jgi:hypothetical protein